MLKPVTRKNIFHSSITADNIIATMQQSYASDFDLINSSEAAIVNKFYDHQQPFHFMDSPMDNHCVLAYSANSLKDYLNEIPGVLQTLFEALEIKQLYLLDFLNTTLDEFPFQNYKKRNDFRRIAGRNIKHSGYCLDTADLKNILNLFFFSGHHGRPILFFIPTNDHIAISTRLCSDGNFHINFQEQNANQIFKAAKNAGFKVGDIDLCWEISLFKYPSKNFLNTSDLETKPVQQTIIP